MFIISVYSILTLNHYLLECSCNSDHFKQILGEESRHQFNRFVPAQSSGDEALTEPFNHIFASFHWGTVMSHIHEGPDNPSLRPITCLLFCSHSDLITCGTLTFNQPINTER